MRRRRPADLDLLSWPAFDVAALPRKLQQTCRARRQAIELYVGGEPLREIEALTGVDRSQIYRRLDHCLAPHEDGRPYGWRALVPYARVTEYTRISRLWPSRGERPKPGASGSDSDRRTKLLVGLRLLPQGHEAAVRMV